MTLDAVQSFDAVVRYDFQSELGLSPALSVNGLDVRAQ